MAGFALSAKKRLVITISISFSFFATEIAIAFKTRSLALMADAFHYMNDLIGFVVALVAIIISERATSPQDLSFGWQRASLLGAFFNGVFLLALGISIFLQSIERFISVERIDDPRLVMIVGCVGLGLNIISAAFVHEHHGHDHGHDQSGRNHEENQTNRQSQFGGTIAMDSVAVNGPTDPPLDSPRHEEHRHNLTRIKKPGRDLGMLGVLVHVIGDAINNIGVIVAAVIIWQTHYEARFYADPAASMFIAIMILLSSMPLVKNSGAILLQSAPRGVELEDVKHDLEKIPGIESVHELHIWRLDQKKAIASVHVVVSDQTVSNFMEKARTVSECLHAYGIHSATLQPELLVLPQQDGSATDGTVSSTSSTLRRRRLDTGACQMVCGNLCSNLMCCTKIEI